MSMPPLENILNQPNDFKYLFLEPSYYARVDNSAVFQVYEIYNNDQGKFEVCDNPRLIRRLEQDSENISKDSLPKNILDKISKV